MPHAQIFDEVIVRGARPSFPLSAPAEYVRLAGRGWAAVASVRPAFAEVVARLELLLAAVSIVASARRLPQPQPRPPAPAAAAAPAWGPAPGGGAAE